MKISCLICEFHHSSVEKTFDKKGADMRLFKRKQKELEPVEKVVQAPNIKAPDRIKAFRYTYETWKKENKTGTQLDYERMVYPNNLFMFLTKFINGLGSKFIINNETQYSFVPIDKHYFKWLEENNKTDSLKTKGEYCQSLTDDEIYELMKENEWDEEYEIVGIPLYAINSKLEEIAKTYYKIEPELKEDLNNYLENIYGQGNVFIPGYILTQNDFFQDERDFIQIAKLHFKKNTNVRFIKWEEQRYNNKVALIYPLVIPFAIKRQYLNARLNLEELLCPVVSLTSSGLKNLGIESCDFKATETYKKIKEYFGEQTIIMESVVRSADIPDVNRKILSQLSR